MRIANELIPSNKLIDGLFVRVPYYKSLWRMKLAVSQKWKCIINLCAFGNLPLMLYMY